MSHRVRPGAAAAGLFVAFVLVAACSRGGKTTATNPSPGPRGQFQAYVDCMRAHGVPLTVPSGRPSGLGPSDRVRPSDGIRPSDGARPSNRGGPPGFPFPGGAPPSGVDQATFDKAQQACASLRPSGGPGGRNQEGRNGAITAYRNCLRDHGVTDPRAEQASADPALAAALAACAPLRPSPPQRSP
jgi:hypothetical protein